MHETYELAGSLKNTKNFKSICKENIKLVREKENVKNGKDDYINLLVPQ